MARPADIRTCRCHGMASAMPLQAPFWLSIETSVHIHLAKTIV
jgi:hypothetical protein